MIDFSISILIPDFDKHPTEIECPVCNLNNWITIGEIKRRNIIVCRGCHGNIYLIDHLGSVQRSFSKIKKQLQNMAM